MLATAVGLPGSGKSHFLGALAGSFPGEVERVRLTGRLDRLFWAKCGAIARPALAMRFLQALIQQPVRLWPYLAHLLTISFAEETKGAFLARRFPGKAHVVDEGILQRALSFADSPAFPRLWPVAVRAMWADAILVFSGGDFGRFEAVADAGESPRVRMGLERYQAWKQAFQERFRSAWGDLRGTGKAIWLDVRHAADLQPELARVHALLRAKKARP